MEFVYNFCKSPICIHAHFSIRVFTFILIDLKAALSSRDLTLCLLTDVKHGMLKKML